MRLRSLVIAGAVAFGATAAAQAADPGLLYKLESTATLPSTDSGWDYIKMQPGTSRLFLARDVDGLTVFDVDQNKASRPSRTRRAPTAVAAASVQPRLHRQHRWLVAEHRSADAQAHRAAGARQGWRSEQRRA